MLTKLKEHPIKSAIVGATSIVGLIIGVFQLDDRYVHRDDIKVITNNIQDITDKTDKLVTMFERQLTTRKTILEHKQARNEITPSEQVELDNLKKMLDL